MSLDVPRLEAAIRRNDPAAVRAELPDASEAERKTASKALKELLRGPAFPDDMPVVVLRPEDLAGLIASGFRGHAEAGREHAERERKYQEWRAVANGLAFQLAVLGLAGGVAAAVRAAQDFPHSYEMTDADIGLAAALLADRAPGWLADLVDRHLRAHGQYQLGIPVWPLARKLVKRGAITRPSVPEYTTLLPGGLLHRAVGRGRTQGPLPSPAQALLADPALLEEEVWRLFTVPDAGLVLEQADRRADWMRGRDWVYRSRPGRRLSCSCARRGTWLAAVSSTRAWTRSAGTSPRTGCPGTRSRCGSSAPPPPRSPPGRGSTSACSPPGPRPGSASGSRVPGACRMRGCWMSGGCLMRPLLRCCSRRRASPLLSSN